MNKLVKILSLSILLIFTSCATRKDFTYLQDMEELYEYPVTQKNEVVIHRDDRLSIIVNSQNPELALPFNITNTGGGYSVGADGSIMNTNNYNYNNNRQNEGYLVDIKGEINFPILGKLHVEGLTREQATQLIRNRLIEGGYINDPIVRISFLNFKIAVMGEVAQVGTFNITDERITLLEAIAMAGDLTPRARLDRIAVIREYGEKRRILYHDLRSKDIFTSPCYYLQQNDIVYVEPNKQKATEQDQRRFSTWTMVLSFISTITSLILIYTK